MPNFIDMVGFALMFGVSVMAAFVPIAAGAFLFIKLMDSIDKEKK